MTTLNTKQPICLPSLKILGDYWSLRIIDVLSTSAERFSELQRQIGDANTATLSNRLKRLETDGVISRTEHSRAEVTYELTALGQKAIPLLVAVNEFSAYSQKLQPKQY
jgi:DNA-binding HxlR family transcriptional regulator